MMNQTSFSLSNVSSSPALLAENKGGKSLDVSEQEGEGFLAKLAQFISGEGESVDGETSSLSQGEVGLLNPEDLTQDELDQGELEGGDLQGDALLELGSEIDFIENSSVLISKSPPQENIDETALQSGNEKNAKPSLESDVVLGKQDREALLQRLNESALALQNPSGSKAEKSASKENHPLDGKALPQDLKTGIAAEKIMPVSLQEVSGDFLKSRDENTDIKTGKNLAKDLMLDPQSLQSIDKHMLSKILGDEASLENKAMISAQKGRGAEIVDAPQDGDVLLTKEAMGALQSQDKARVGSLVDPDVQAQTPLGEMMHSMKPEKDKMTASLQNEIIDPAAGVIVGEMPTKTDANDKLQGSPLAGQQPSPLQEASLFEGEKGVLLMDERSSSGARQHSMHMSQAAVAVQSALNPTSQSIQQTSVAAVFASIPWTPQALKTQDQAGNVSPDGALESLTSLGLADPKSNTPETKADQFAQQFASSIGTQGSTAAARLDNGALQTPLQLSENQAEAADALSEKINIMLSKNLKYVDIRLDPPELGKMQIKLSMNQDQASVQFTVANQSVREMVEQTLPRLREMMQQQGLQLAQSSVQQQDAGGRQGFSDNQTQQGQRDKNHASGFERGETESNIELGAINHEFNVTASKDRVDFYA